MLKTKRRRWLLVAALFFLAAFGVAIAQIVTAQGEEASGVRHIIRTNASGELITAPASAPTEVEGTTADGAAFSDNPVVIGGVDAGGDAQQALMDANGRQIVTSEAGAPVYTIETVPRREGTVSDGGAAAAQRPLTAGGVDGAGNVQRVLVTAAGEVETQSQGTTADGAPFSDNPVVMGGVDGAGNTQQMAISTLGVLATGSGIAGADGILNASLGIPRTSAGVGWYPASMGHVFNGATWDRQFVCSLSVPISTAGAGTTQIIALNGSTIIRICHISLSWDAAVDWRIVQGTGANCGTGTANLTADYQNITSIALDFAPDAAVRSAAGSAVCITQAGAGNSGGVVSYAQF